MLVSACTAAYEHTPQNLAHAQFHSSTQCIFCCQEFEFVVCKERQGRFIAGFGNSVLSTSPSDLSARILLTHLEANYFAPSPVSDRRSSGR